MVVKKYIKPTYLALLFLLVLSLASCGKTKNLAYGDLSDSNVYMQSGNLKVTEKELYEKMVLQRDSGSYTVTDVLSEEINRLLLKESLAEVDNKWTFKKNPGNKDEKSFKERAENKVKTSVYGTDKQESIDKLSNTQKKSMEKQFLDSVALTGILTDNILDAKVLESYKLEFAKEVFARKILEKSVDKEKILDADDKEISNPDYISDKAIQDYYDMHYKGRNDFSAIIIKFTNLAEVEKSLDRTNDYTKLTFAGTNYHGVKSFKGKFYLVPETLAYEAVITSEDLNNKGYKALDDISFSKEILMLYVNIYANLFSYKAKIEESDINHLKTLAFDDLVDKLVKDYDIFNHEYDEMLNSNYALTNFLVSELKEKNTEAYKEEKPRYTSTAKFISDNYYMLYKISDGEDKTLNDELKAEIKEKIINEKLTGTYASSIFEEAKTELITVEIYDKIIEILYAGKYTSYKKVKKSDKNILAKIKIADDEELNEKYGLDNKELTLSVREFYNVLEKNVGYYAAYVLLSSKALLLRDDIRAKITEDEKTSFKKDFDSTMKTFNEDGFASLGLPSSIKKKLFIRIYFNASSEKEAIEKYYTLAKMTNYYAEDYSFLFKQNQEILKNNGISAADADRAMYLVFEKYAQRSYESYYSISASHLLVYLDIDEDGNPDNISKILDSEELEEYNETVLNLLKEIYQSATVDLSAKYVDSLKYLADQYNKSNKYSLKYGELRKKGILLKFENLSTITNTASLNYDEIFIEQLEKMEKKFINTSEVFDEQYLQEFSDKDDLTLSSFGWHMILLTGITDKENNSSAKYTQDNDYASAYSAINYVEADGTTVTLNAYSDYDYLSSNQIEIYIREKDRTNGVENLPSKVKTAASNYLMPAINKYNSTENRMFLMRQLILDYKYTNDHNAEVFLTALEVNVRKSNDYATLDRPEKNPLYSWYFDLYGFKIREGK